MKTTFRFLSLLICAALLLAACAPAISAPTKPATQEPTAVAPVAEKVTITVWDFGGNEFSWMDAIVIPAFKEKFPNITIAHVGVPESDLGTKLETAIAAKEGPDLVLFPPPRVIAAGHAMPLDDYMARDGLKRSDFCSIFNSENMFAGGSMYKDKVYGLPIDTNIWGMIYNKKLFKEAGLPLLTAKDYIDFDQWLQYAKAINKPGKTLNERVFGSVMLTPSWNSMNNYMSDPYVLGPDGRTAKGNAETDDWIHTWKVLTQAYKDDVTTATAGALLKDVQDDMFLQGKLGMRDAAFGDAVNARSKGIDVGITGQPVVTKGWTGNVGGWNTWYVLMKASKHPDEAWQFLKYLSTEAPLIVPIGPDQTSGTSGLPGLPCYQPLLKEKKFADLLKNDPLAADFLELQTHIKNPPFTPDIWTTVDPFTNGFTRMTEGGEDVATVVHESAAESQTILDGLWKDFDALGN